MSGCDALSCLSHPLSVCFTPSLSSLLPLSLPFIMTVSPCVAPGKVLRVHDVMKWWEETWWFSSFSPKATSALFRLLTLSVYISLAPSFCSPFLYLSGYLLRIYCVQFLHQYQWVCLPPMLHKYPSEEIILDSWLFNMTHSGGFCWFDCRLMCSSPSSTGRWGMSPICPFTKL